MFEPHDILDPNERLLEPIKTGAAAGLVRLSAPRLLWLTGAALCALGTWVILTTSDTRELALESAQVLPVQSPEQSSQLANPEPFSGSPATPQLPQEHAGAADQATPEREQAAPSTSDDADFQQGDVESPASTSAHADKLEPIDPAAQGTPHAIVPEPSLSEALAAEEKESPPSTRERVRVASAASIHSGPSASDALLGTAQVGAEAEVASRNAEWVQIIEPASGKMGWIHSNHLVPTPAGGEQRPNNESNPLPSGEQAALADEQEVVPLPPAQPEPSLKSKKKSHKYGWRKKRYKRGLAFRFVVRRLR